MKFRPTIRSLKAYAVAAFASAAMFGGSADAQNVDWSYLNDSPVRFDASGVGGNQLGVQDGYFRTGAFMKIFEDQSSILFLDGHGNVNNVSGNWSGDLGIGYRQDVGSMVLGGNSYYNYREYSNGVANHSFSTLGFGVEALMSDWAIRSNASFSLDSRVSNGLAQFALPGGPDLVPQMSGSMGVSNIRLATQTENFDAALDVYDLTISRKIPSVRTEFGAGVYYLSADGGSDAWGVNGTAEMWITSNIAGNFNASHDNFFDTTVYGGVSIYFGGPAIDANSRTQSVKSRLWSRVQRRNVIPVLNYTTDAPDLLAHDAGSGDLISVAQISTAPDLLGAPNLLEDDGDFIDIILVDPGVMFGPGDLTGTIALNDNQRLLSGQIVHGVNTLEFGTIQLPETLLGGGPAVLTSATAIDAITLANDNEVSGFDITGGGSGIVGTDVTRFNINQNLISSLGGEGSPGGVGVDIDSSGLPSVSGSLSNNTITSNSVNGVNINGVNVAVDFTENTIIGSGFDNVVISSTGDFSGMIVGNDFRNSAGGQGLNLTAMTISGAIIDNSANGNFQDGLSIVVDSVAPGSTLNITDNTTNLNGGDGISLVFNGDVDSNIFVDDNTADANMGDGISIVSNGMGNILGTISNNTTNGNDPGIFIESNDAASDLFLDLINNVANNNTMQGILINAANNFTGEVSGNTANLNGESGLEINAGNDLVIDLVNNMFNGNTLGSGAELVANGNITGAASGNMASGNAEAGLLFGATGNIDLDVLNNTTNDNLNGGGPPAGGISLLALGNIDGLIDGNTSNGNAESGILIFADLDGDNMGDVNAIVSNNTTGTMMGNGNGANGIFISGENITGAITDNTANGNGANGIIIDGGTIGTGMNSFIIDNNITGVAGMPLTGNGDTGIFITSTGDVFATISNNNANENMTDGIFADVNTNFTGDITGNMANGNALDGIHVDTGNDFTGNVGDVADVLLGNLANNNGANGFIFGIANDFTGDFANNTANDNVGDGFSTTAGGAVMGTLTPNTAAGNGTDFNSNIAAP